LERINKWTNLLIEKGVSDEHIQNMKKIKLQYQSPYHLVYEEKEDLQKLHCVETHKIKGIATGWKTANKSVYDLFFSFTGEIPNLETSINASRIRQNLDSLICHGIKYQHNFYKDPSKINKDEIPTFNYFEDDDVYFPTDATHRTISALMFNAPKMVGKIKVFKKNNLKARNYSLYNKVLGDWKKFLSTKLYVLNINENPDTNNIIFSIKLPKHSKSDFFFSINNPIIDLNSNQLEDSQLIEDQKKRVETLINNIKQIDKRLSSSNLDTLPFYLKIVKNNIFLYSLYFIFNKEEFVNIEHSQPKVSSKRIKASVKRILANENFPKK